MNKTPRRVVTTHQQLEELIMDITSHDLNLQMQQLIAEYKKTGDEHSSRQSRSPKRFQC